MQAREGKRVRESEARLLQGIVLRWPPNRARQAPGPLKFFLVAAFVPPRPQYANNRIKVPFLDCLDGLSTEWLAVGNSGDTKLTSAALLLR